MSMTTFPTKPKEPQNYQLAIYNKLAFGKEQLARAPEAEYNISMKQQNYKVLYEADPDGGFVATVPDLPGCCSQGETIIETEFNIAEAIELYLETLEDENLIND